VAQRTGYLSLALSAGICATSVCVVRAIDENYADRMLFADGLFARQMYALAVTEYKATLEAFPDGERNDALLFRLAEGLRLQGDVEQAAQYYSRVVSQHRESAFRLRAAFRRARIYADEGDLASAQSHFEAILAANPEADLAVAVQYYLSEVLFRKDDVKKADEVLAALLREHAETEFRVFALLKRAEIRRSLLARQQESKEPLDAKLVKEAIGFYDEALAAADTDRLLAEVLYQKADILFRQESFEEAAELYRRLIQDYPADPRAKEARLQAAWAALRTDLFAESMAVAQQALTDAQDGDEMTAEWLYILANSQRQLLQTEQAAATYADLLARFPDSRFADASRYETAVAYYQAGNFEAAIRAANRIRRGRERRAEVNWLLAESYAALQRPAEAVQHYRLVVREAGQSERARDALYRLAHQLQQQGSFREASQFYLQLVADFPDAAIAPQALFASGYALAQANAFEEAVRDWHGLVEKYPDSALAQEALYQKAMGEIRLQRQREALGSLAALQRRFPEGRYQADSRYWQGMLHFEAGRHAEAESFLRQALQLASREELKRDAQFQLGLVLQRLDRQDESAAFLHPLIDSPARERFSPALLEWLTSHHGAREEFAEMIATARLLVAKEEPVWRQTGSTLLGRGLAAQGKWPEAEKAWRNALGIQTRTIYAGEAALRLGLLLLERKELAEAEMFLRRVQELAAGQDADAIRSRGLVGLGKVALSGERPADAVRLFLSVGILYDDASVVPESLYLAAQALHTLERKDELQKVLDELGERYPEHEWTSKARDAWGL
jgi:TolA-binding protein